MATSGKPPLSAFPHHSALPFHWHVSDRRRSLVLGLLEFRLLFIFFFLKSPITRALILISVVLKSWKRAESKRFFTPAYLILTCVSHTRPEAYILPPLYTYRRGFFEGGFLLLGLAG